MKHTIAGGLLSLLFIFHGGTYADEPAPTPLGHPSSKREVFLKFNLKPGEKYLFSSTIKQLITQDMMGQQMVTTQDMLSDYIYDVQSVQGGITAINVTFSSIKMDTDIGGMQRLSYDSDNPDAGTAELSALSSMVGKSFLMHIDEAGNVQRVEGLSEIIDSVDEQQAAVLRHSFGDSSMVQNMNQITNIYPNRTVSKGDTWTKSFSGPIAGMLQSNATSDYSLSDVTGDLAIVSADGKMRFSKLEDGGNPLLQGATFNIDGTQKGTLEIDVNSGLPLKTTLKQDIGGTIEIQGMQIPMTIVSDITITGKKM